MFTMVCGRGRLHECGERSPRELHVVVGEPFGEAGVDSGQEVTRRRSVSC